ncbi:MAG: hypothetical protein JSV08_08905 [Acidobacteriota bacterium]|nr:MAG: hypothetical protein JSV08_08905 [Acidobacteriota bacterium]
MKINIRHLRWIFLGLYVVIVTGLFAMAYEELLPEWSWLFIAFGDNAVWTTIVLLVTVASQALFVYGAGTINLCRPIGRRRLLAPVVIAALMMTILMAALFCSLTELFKVDDEEWLIWIFWTLVGVNWVGWCVFFFVRYRQAERLSAVRGMVATVLVGSLAELLIAVPSHIIVSRRPGCFVGMLTAVGIAGGLLVMLWALGPGIILLFLQERRKKELAERIQQTNAPERGGS